MKNLVKDNPRDEAIEENYLTAGLPKIMRQSHPTLVCLEDGTSVPVRLKKTT
jgi:hypothetical protein